MSREEIIKRMDLAQSTAKDIGNFNKNKRLLKEALINAGVDSRKVQQASWGYLVELADGVGVEVPK